MLFKLEIRSKNLFFFFHNPICENIQQAFVGISLCCCVDRLIAICRMSEGIRGCAPAVCQQGNQKYREELLKEAKCIQIRGMPLRPR